MAADRKVKSPVNERAQALAGLHEFREEAAALRAGLRRYERALERVCRQVERNVPLHEVMGQIGVGELRADLVERLTRFEEARHRMRVACFRMSLTEGLSIGDIARLWGISRQLASRLVNEAPESPPSERSPKATSDLPPRLRDMVGSETRRR
jgi:transposase-like protein